METKKDYSPDRIELRSEKVRNIIGTIPPALVRWGIVVITIILVILMLVVLLVPYRMGRAKLSSNIYSFPKKGYR